MFVQPGGETDLCSEQLGTFAARRNLVCRWLGSPADSQIVDAE